jgi:hypothetical protein
MRPRDPAQLSQPRPPSRVSPAAGAAAIVAALGGLIVATGDGLGQLAGLALACGGVVGATLAARVSGGMAGPEIETLEDALASELDRARRHRHSLALVRIARSSPSGRTGGGHADAWSARPAAAVRAADRLWAVDDGLVALLPETTLDGAELAAGRLLDEAGRDDDQIAIAVFPEDGLTGGALLAHLETTRQPTSLAARRRAGDGASAEDAGQTTAIG